jgi:CelD/BcsL family acetyltransferase involved in cellulose biosynthesis
MEQALKIVELRDAASLAALVPQWEDLAAHALEPNPVYEPWMLLPALEAFAGGEELRFILVYYGGELSGLFALRLEPRFRGLPVRTLTSWRHPHCKLCVPLVRANVAREVLKGFLKYSQENASLVELTHLVAEGAFHQALVDALNEGDCTSLTTDAYTRAVLCRASSAEAYLQSMPSGVRHDLRRRAKRLAEAGTVEHVVLRTREELPRWIEEFLALEASGWKGKRGSALACSEANRRFAEELFTRGFERGRLIMVGINFNGKPIARYCGFISGAGAIAFKTGYDETMRRFAPGVLARLDMIRAVHERPGVQWMDSYTDAGNVTVASVWKDRRTVQRVAIAADARGELALAVYPLMRFSKQLLRKLRGRAKPLRTIPSFNPA